MSPSRPSLEGMSGSATRQTSLQTQVCIRNCAAFLSDHMLRATPVADLSVMLALMAGRNGGETVAMVQNGEVNPPLFVYAGRARG